MDIEWIEKHKKDIDYFGSMLPRLLQSADTRGKFFIVRNETLAGQFDTFEKALRVATENYNRDEYIIQQAIDESDTVSFLYSQIHGEEPKGDRSRPKQ
jgi:hypothetical protein